MRTTAYTLSVEEIERKPTEADLEAVRAAYERVAAGLDGLARVMVEVGLLPVGTTPPGASAQPELPLRPVAEARTARSIPMAVAEILRAESRHLFVDELWERLQARGLEVRRASIPRSLSRDVRFERFRDGWGFTAPPSSVLVGTTTNGSQLGVSPAWPFLSAPHPLNLPPQRK